MGAELPAELTLVLKHTTAWCVVNARIALALAHGWDLYPPGHCGDYFVLRPQFSYYCGDSDRGGLVHYARHRTPVGVTASFWHDATLDRTDTRARHLAYEEQRERLQQRAPTLFNMPLTWVQKGVLGLLLLQVVVVALLCAVPEQFRRHLFLDEQ